MIPRLNNSEQTFKKSAFLFSASLGSGLYPLTILTLGSMLSKIVGRKFWEMFFHCISESRHLFIALIFFLGSYWAFHAPQKPGFGELPWGYFPIFSTASFITAAWVTCNPNRNSHIEFVWGFSLGALTFCLVTVVITLFDKPPPLYASVIDIRYIPLGMKVYMNTPGIANLLCLFTSTFLAGLILDGSDKPKGYWIVGVAGFILSFLAAAAIEQRSYFVITFVIQPAIVTLFLIINKKWKSTAFTLMIAFCYPLYYLTAPILGITLNRPINLDILNDARFQILNFWLTNFIDNPFNRSQVGPAPWDQLHWFHNFFADIHRVSGLWTLICAFILILYILYKIIHLIQIDKEMSLFLLAIAIPCLLILNTSVVPEGEMQPFLLLLAIGAISQSMVSIIKFDNLSINRNSSTN